MFNAAIAAAAEAAPIVAPKKPVVPGLQVHVDGDYLAYFASGNDETEPGMARLNALSIIEGFKDAIGAETAVVHSTASGSHKGERYLAATVKPYQGQRDPGRKPKNYGYLREWLLNYAGEDYRSKVWSSREADDGIGACARFAVDQGRLDGIATADKDMRMLPGLHIDWKDRTLVTEVPHGTFATIGKNGKLYGLKWFWLQMLMGDTADNCPGIEYVFIETVSGKAPERMSKCGEKTAEKLLTGIDNSDDAGRAVIDIYRRSYRGMANQDRPGSTYADDRFVEQACLMWMRLGNGAAINDFRDHIGHLFDDHLHAATDRLVTRIGEAREALDNLRS